jgi:hypothetical protein
MNMLKRKLKLLLVPAALIVMVVGTVLPASASTLPTDQAGQTATTVVKVKPLSLNW